MADDRRKLYRSKEHPDRWIGEDEHGVLMIWPAHRRGWLKRTGFSGPKRQLEEVDASLARGTGWPFGPVGRRPRGSEPSSTLGIRVTTSERAKWQRAADKHERGLTVWARDELNAAADRTLDEDSPRPRSKSKP
jgi:hypothetical protein